MMKLIRARPRNHGIGFSANRHCGRGHALRMLRTCILANIGRRNGLLRPIYCDYLDTRTVVISRRLSVAENTRLSTI